MDTASIFIGLLILSTLLCSLVAGLVFAFAVVVMPGIKNLKDAEFIRAFQVVDGVIQNNQPLFMLVWVGSALALIASSVLALGQLEGIECILLIGAAFVYIAGVQLPTITINIPLNNQLQTIDTRSASESALAEARSAFEQRWNFWNTFRTGVSILVSLVLMMLLYCL